MKVQTRLALCETLPLMKSAKRHALEVDDPSAVLLIFDRRLERVSREFRAWAKQFPRRYAVDSGERLKDLAKFPKHAERLLALAGDLPARSMTVVAVGGGSVGDFAGFFASIYRRGVELVHVPSTWLAAIDSSHGGKTALNLGGVKNQFGTFHPARTVALVHSLLVSQPNERVSDAMGELGKIALIDGGTWVTRLERTRLEGSDLLWSFLKPAIDSKMRIVNRDPKERSGLRQVLNLGHTMGHVAESALGLSHGTAVAHGLFFAIEFSRRRKMISAADADRARKLLVDKLHLEMPAPAFGLSAERVRKLLLADKKRAKRGSLTYVFLRGIGRVERVEIRIDELLAEAVRQGWVRKR